MSDDAVIVTHRCGHDAVCNPEQRLVAAQYRCLPCSFYAHMRDCLRYAKMLGAQAADVADCREKDRRPAAGKEVPA